MKFLGRKLRHELKYYLHLQDYLSIRQRVASMLRLDSNSKDNEGYGIRSLYFDGPQDQAIYDKNNGVFNREKYRIRIYNGSAKTIKLERKSKFGEFVSKESASLTLEEYTNILKSEMEGMRNTEIALVKEFYRAVKYSGFRPTAVVDYIREAYIYEPGDTRITFDKRLSAGVNTYDILDEHLVKVEVLDPSLTILEVKYNTFLPDVIRQLLSPNNYVRSTISKYVICREINYKHFNS